MSHVFEALRKSKGQAENEDVFAPEAIFRTPEKVPDFGSIRTENAEIRPEVRLAVWDNPGTLAADRYRLLRLQLEKLQSKRTLRTILLTSASPQDGKSTVALNLAVVLAGQGKHRVLVLEADLRCPSFVRRLGLSPWKGLSECLAHGLDPVTAVRRVDPLQFYLLPAGERVDNPTELLQSERLTHLVQAMSGWFDWILIDSPPVSPIADTLALKPRADASLLVVRSGKTPREAVEEAIQQLGPGFVMGIVLNGAKSLNRKYAEYYSKYYGQTIATKRKVVGRPAK